MSIVGRNNAFDPLSRSLWDPFDGFSFGQSLPFPSDSSDLSMACLDWKETPKSHVLKMDLPGMKKQDVKLEVEGNIIHISGERFGESHDENATWHLVERNTGKFTRSFRLPEDAKIDQIKASMENGVLTVTVPKEEVKKRESKTRSIEIEGGQGGVLSRLKMPSLFKPKKI